MNLVETRERAYSQLGSAETYHILSHNGCIKLDGVDDVEQFKAVQRAFDTIGMDAATQMQVRGGRRRKRRTVLRSFLAEVVGVDPVVDAVVLYLALCVLVDHPDRIKPSVQRLRRGSPHLRHNG